MDPFLSSGFQLVGDPLGDGVRLLSSDPEGYPCNVGLVPFSRVCAQVCDVSMCQWVRWVSTSVNVIVSYSLYTTWTDFQIERIKFLLLRSGE